MHINADPRVLYFGTPVVLVSTTNEDGSANIAPMSSAWWVSRSCMLGLDESSTTTENLVRNKECVLNLPSSQLVAAVDRLALLTGSKDVPGHKKKKGYRYEPDKFAAAGLTAVASEAVVPPRIAECPIQLEGMVRQVHPFEADDSGLIAIEVQIVRVHIEEGLLVSGSSRYVDADRWDPLIMKFCEFYGGGVNVHPSRLARGWEMPERESASATA